MLIHDEINQKYQKQWQEGNVPGDYGNYFPFFYPPFPEDQECFREYVLFVGMNPSLTPKLSSNYLISNGIQKSDISSVSQIDEQLEKTFPFFKKMWEIASELGIGMEHIDLFSVRGTSQAKLGECLNLNIDQQRKVFKKANDFRDEQLDIFFTTLLKLRPKVIVVANALASNIFHLMHRKYCFSLRYHEEFGYHLLSYSGREVPIFFSGMLSGGHALDNYSFRRLKWHIQFSLKNKSVTYY